MGNKQPLAEPVERRHESENEKRPTKRKAAHLPQAHAPADPGPAPEPRDTGSVKAAGEGEGENDPGIEGPRRAELRPMQVALMSERLPRKQHGNEEREH